jgi:hypothetical protein
MKEGIIKSRQIAGPQVASQVTIAEPGTRNYYMNYYIET